MTLVSVERQVDDRSRRPVVAREEVPAPIAPPAPQVTTGVVLKRASTILCLLVLAVYAFVAVGSQFMHNRAQRTLGGQFKTLAANASLAPTVASTNFDEPTAASKAAAALRTVAFGTAVASLRIPAIGVDEIVVEGSTPSQTMQGPGHLSSTPLPGQFGNSVVVGRRVGYGGPFGRLGALHRGAQISTISSSGKKTYLVQTVAVRPASDASIFATHNGTTTLTLVTTADDWDTSRRLVVTARLAGTAKGFSPGRFAPKLDELGLDRDGNALLPMVFALQILFAAIVGALWLRSRWSQAATWIVVAPIVVAATWYACEQLTRVLPATL